MILPIATRRVLSVAALAVALAVVVVLIRYGYRLAWTGLPAYTSSSGQVVPAKTLWDWLDLLIVPLFLAIAAYLLDGSRKRSDQRVESDRQRQKVLEDYFACLTDLLLERKLATPVADNTVASIARTRTVAALRILDGRRKAQLLQFIYEAGLIGQPPIIQLNGADLSAADLTEATLRECELRGVHFQNAVFRNADLSHADLRGSDFSGADLTNAQLRNTNLAQANFQKANLSDADLSGAAVEDVDFPDVSGPPMHFTK